jgi:hypothetical protein
MRQQLGRLGRAAVVVAAMVPFFTAVGASAALTPVPRVVGHDLSGVNVLGLSPCSAYVLYSNGVQMWVADPCLDTLWDLSVASGQPIRRIELTTFGIKKMLGVASNGQDIWTPTAAGIDEFSASTGRLVKTIGGPRYQFSAPFEVEEYAGRVWVLNWHSHSITEFAASSGAFIRLVKGGAYHLGTLCTMSSDGAHLWLSFPITNSITEISLTGALVRVIQGPAAGLRQVGDINSDGTHVWITNGGDLVELSAVTGAFVRVIRSVQSPLAVVSDGSHVWVAGKTVTELSAANGAVIRQFSGAPYLNAYSVAYDRTSVFVSAGTSILEIGRSSGSLVRDLQGSAYGFDSPTGIATGGNDIWVSNAGSNAGTEVNATTGAVVRHIAGSAYGFEDPGGVADDGSHIWVMNNDYATYTGSITEFNAGTGAFVQNIPEGATVDAIAADSAHAWALVGGTTLLEFDAATGTLVQALSGSAYQFSGSAISSDGTDVWVVNSYNNSVTEVSASTGAAVAVLSAATYGFDRPNAIYSDGTDVWVSNLLGFSVTELSASTGAFIRLIHGAGYGFNAPDGIGSDGTHVWVANGSEARGHTVTELTESNGAPDRVLNQAAYAFYAPSAVAVAGGKVWVLNPGSNSVTEFPAT